MAAYPQKFAELLTEAVHRVRIRESKSVQIVQDELGYAMGREGGSAIEYWRKGHIPPKLSDVEQLGRELVVRGRLEREWLEAFLVAAEHPAADRVCDELFGSAVDVPPHNRRLNQVELPGVESFAPFIVGPPIVHPGKFFGRDREIKRIFGAWQRYPLQNVAVVGPKRSGKTSLLHYVKNVCAVATDQLRSDQTRPEPKGLLSKPEEFTWVYVDFQDVRMTQQARLLRHILETVLLPVPDPCDLSRFMDVMIDNLRTPTIILMDEIGAALDAPELDMSFWWSLRSLGTNLTDGNLGYIIASHEQPAKLAADQGKPSPYFNIFGHVLNLGPIDEKAARALICEGPLTPSDEDLNWILQTSQRWPVLLQILGHSYMTVVEEGIGSTSWQEEGLARIQQYAYLLELSSMER